MVDGPIGYTFWESRIIGGLCCVSLEVDAKYENDEKYVADVFVSVLGSDQDEKNAMVGLESSASYLRNHLARNMSTRTVPKLKFILDKGLDHSERIQQILSDLKEDES